MRRSLTALIPAVALLLTAAPAFACDGDCDCPHKAAKKKSHDTQAAPSDSVLAPVDEILSATCSCSGPSDCTCKKGECKCKKCSHHHHQGGEKKTELLEPLKGRQLSPVVPQNARLEATGGTMI